MKTLLLLAWCAIAVVQARAADAPTILSLVGREFAIRDDWAGQELAFRRHGDSIRAVWRILGSGVAVVSEVESPVEINNPRKNVFEVLFEVQLRDRSRGKLKVELGENAAVRIYLNGVRIDSEEKKPHRISSLRMAPYSTRPRPVRQAQGSGEARRGGSHARRAWLI